MNSISVGMNAAHDHFSMLVGHFRGLHITFGAARNSLILKASLASFTRSERYFTPSPWL